MKLPLFLVIIEIASVYTKLHTKTTTSPTTTSSATTITPLFAPFPEHHWPYTKILAKKSVDLRNHTDYSVQIACPADGDFLTFIRDSALWIDKSLLVRKIWEGLWSYHITAIAPPKWGKSINLSMLKFFCEIPLDADGFELPKDQSPSHFYFNEGKVVSKDGTIEELDGTPLLYGYEEHLANHPVIFMSGINLRMDDDAESLRIMIHETYQRHKSLLNRLKLNFLNSTGRQRAINAQHLAEFRAFYELEEIWKLDKIQITFGIQNLTRLLFDVYQRKVVILFDDCDCFGHRAYFDGRPSNSTDYWNQFARTWEMFSRYTFKQNRHLEKAVLTGVFKMHDPSILLKYPNHHGAYVFDDENLYPFYGIYEKEFLQMANRRGIDRNLRDEAKQWYGGYRALSHLDVEMYSPYSITRFWNTLQIQMYQPKSRLSKFAHGLFRRPDFQQRVRSMVESYLTGDHMSVIFHRNMKNLKMNEYVDIQRVHQGELQYDAQNEEVLFSYLVSTGYAALHEWFAGKTMIKIKIPNREICNQINATLHEKIRY